MAHKKFGVFCFVVACGALLLGCFPTKVRVVLKNGSSSELTDVVVQRLRGERYGAFEVLGSNQEEEVKVTGEVWLQFRFKRNGVLYAPYIPFPVDVGFAITVTVLEQQLHYLVKYGDYEDEGTIALVGQ